MKDLPLTSIKREEFKGIFDEALQKVLDQGQTKSSGEMDLISKHLTPPSKASHDNFFTNDPTTPLPDT